MLSRYKIYRGKRPDHLPNGIRQDSRKHTKHCLRPPGDIVLEYLANPSSDAWTRFKANYLQSLKGRHDADPTPFDKLAELASTEMVYIGCSCPTSKNPDVNRCHTVLALRFMKELYPQLEIEFP
jgi:hypothetical protein